MRKSFKVPYIFTYGGSLGRKVKHIEISFTMSNENIVIDTIEGDPEAAEIFKSEVLGSFGRRSKMEKYLQKACKELK